MSNKQYHIISPNLVNDDSIQSYLKEVTDTEECIYVIYTLVYAEPMLTFVLLLILPSFLKPEGVWLAVPIAQGLTFLIALSEQIMLSKKNIPKQRQI